MSHPYFATILPSPGGHLDFTKNTLQRPMHESNVLGYGLGSHDRWALKSHNACYRTGTLDFIHDLLYHGVSLLVGFAVDDP